MKANLSLTQMRFLTEPPKPPDGEDKPKPNHDSKASGVFTENKQPAASKTEDEMEDEKWRSCYHPIRGIVKEEKKWIDVPLTGKKAKLGETFKASPVHAELAAKCKWTKSVGYAFNSKYGYFHRAIYGEAADDYEVIDHINRDRLDNRVENLRGATYSLNGFNKNMSTRNTSGFRGVSPLRGKWTAYIGVDGQSIWLGTFRTKEDAHRARKKAEIQYYGEELEDSLAETAEKDERKHYTDGKVGYLSITGSEGIKRKLYAIISLEDFEKASKVKWCLSDEYPFNRRLGKLSRYILDYHGPLLIDHRDGEPLNNQRDNLRQATSAQNNMNSCLRSDNTSGHKGIRYEEKRETWIARINFQGYEISLGTYPDKKSAVEARMDAEKVLHREWARGASPDLVKKLSLESKSEADAAIERALKEIREKKKQRLKSTNTSGAKGVKFDKSNKIWVARIGFEGENFWLGSFVDKHMAVKARQEAEEVLEREWARHKDQTAKARFSFKDDARAKGRIKQALEAIREKNKHLRSNNKSGTAGVSFDKRSQMWRARVRVDGKMKHVGYFPDTKSAVAACNRAQAKLLGNKKTSSANKSKDSSKNSKEINGGRKRSSCGSKPPTKRAAVEVLPPIQLFIHKGFPPLLPQLEIAKPEIQPTPINLSVQKAKQVIPLSSAVESEVFPFLIQKFFRPLPPNPPINAIVCKNKETTSIAGI